MSDELFPLLCPTCSAPLDHDGIGRCSLVIAALRARIAELTKERDELTKGTDDE